jgi:hypothetical protein
MKRNSALILGGGVVGLLVSVFPLGIGALSVSCICGKCANPTPALLMYPVPAVLMLSLRQLTDPPALVGLLAVGLAVLQLPVYGAYLVASSLRRWPHRGLASAVAIHPAVIAVVCFVVWLRG